MAQYLLKSESGSTIVKYQSYFSKWEHFIHNEGHCNMPANPVHITIYFTKLLDNHASYHVLSSSKYDIKCLNELSGYSDTTNNVFVNNLVLNVERQFVKKKKAIVLLGFNGANVPIERYLYKQTILNSFQTIFKLCNVVEKSMHLCSLNNKKEF
ncbi:hypothetical protein KUTeg_024509 [Tegillarca granosa]|uniref:Uncharacterized protein n=1 Tax=Tegillarca granosa TaxID=220873 RepID=A0ABQ9DXK0_TEGGR|nr:hypothetical protein KUTeg_024509 [Tegillarca granosa]